MAADERAGPRLVVRRPAPPLLPAYAAQSPYNAIVVELAEAPHIRLVGNLVTGPGAALNSLAAERIRIGARVRVVFSGEGLPQWVLEGRS